MSSSNQMKLLEKSIINVPLCQCDDDFYFIVNGEEYKTTRIISDLLSPRICHIHRSDPTNNIFQITTQQNGDFSKILNLVDFNKHEIEENEIEFISEVIEFLGNEFIIVDIKHQELTEDNALDLLQEHLKLKIFGSKLISKEIDFISSHFYEFLENQVEKIMNIDIEIIEKIISNNNLIIRNENQLLSFINNLYSSDSNYANLYEFVLFQNVDKESIEEFLSIYNINDITHEIWESISCRLKQKVINNDEKESKTYSRYKQIFIIIYTISTNILSNFNKYFMKFIMID